MKVKLLFLGLCFSSISCLSYGQSEVLMEPAPVVVSSHPDLSAQRAKLDQKQAELDQALAGSKGQFIRLKDEFRVLKEEYVRMLRVALSSATNETQKIQLENEIVHYSETTHSSNK